MKLFNHDLDGRRDGGFRSIAQLVANGGGVDELRTHDTLRKDEWKSLDTVVVKIALKRLRVVGELLAMGLRHNLANALGTMILEFERESDMNAAVVNMNGKSGADNDTVEYSLSGLPIPITSKGFELNARRLAASRKLGQPLDTTQAAMSTRKVSDEIESMTIKGQDTAGNALTFGGYTIYGFENYTDVNTGTLTSGWDNDSARDPKKDVLAMVQACIDVNMYGPFGIYSPRPYASALGDDYVATTSTTITIRERLEKIEGIQFVRTADYCTNTKVSLVQLDEQTIRMVHGQDPTPVEWKSGDNMTMYHKVMAIIVPQIRSDKDGNCGIAVYSE